MRFLNDRVMSCLKQVDFFRVFLNVGEIISTNPRSCRILWNPAFDLMISATYLPKNQEELDVPKNLRGKKKRSCLDSQKGWPMVATCDEKVKKKHEDEKMMKH